MAALWVCRPPLAWQGIDFDSLDKRTGKSITRENIVKRVHTGDGEYAVVSKEEIEAAYPRSTETIEIERFVKPGEIPISYLERPYCLTPTARLGNPPDFHSSQR